MNKVILSGNLTRDPELRRTSNGLAYARTGIAVNRAYSKNNDGQTQVDFFNMTVWDKQAEFCERYMKKGSSVIVEGRVENSNYEKDGVKHYSVNIMVERIEFAGSKRSNDNGSSSDYNPGNDSETNYGGNDVDVPF